MRISFRLQLGGSFGSSAFCGLLFLQSSGQTGHLRSRSVEQACGLCQVALHRAGKLGQQDLAGLEVRDLVDLVHGQRSAVHVAALDDERLVVLSEVLQSLRSIDGLALDECNGGRTDEKVIKALDARLSSGTLDQGVLGDGVGGTFSESASQCRDVAHRQTTVFRDHSSGRTLNCSVISATAETFSGFAILRLLS